MEKELADAERDPLALLATIATVRNLLTHVAEKVPFRYRYGGGELVFDASKLPSDSALTYHDASLSDAVVQVAVDDLSDAAALRVKRCANEKCGEIFFAERRSKSIAGIDAQTLSRATPTGNKRRRRRSDAFTPNSGTAKKAQRGKENELGTRKSVTYQFAREVGQTTMAFLVIQYRMAAVALFLAAACSTMVEQPLLPDDRAYLDNAMAQSLSFTMPTAQANDAWGRAQVFVVKNSDLKIQVATEYVLQTYNPTVDTGTFAYEASRTPRGESTEFTVRCDTPSSETMPRSNRLAHLMAYFVATGRSVPEELLKWCPYAISAGGGPPQGCFERKLF